MKTMFLTGAMSLALACAPAALAAEDQGDVALTLHAITALDQTGQPDPYHDAECQARYGEWIGKVVETQYSINPETMWMTATSVIEGVEVRLYPLGIQGLYAFMSDDLPQPLQEQQVIRVLFQISIGYDHPESRIMTSLTDTVNCLIES
jgi:hypothetical protein